MQTVSVTATSASPSSSASSSSLPQSQSTPHPRAKLSTAAIAGISAGVVLGAICVALSTQWAMRWRRRKADEQFKVTSALLRPDTTVPSCAHPRSAPIDRRARLVEQVTALSTQLQRIEEQLQMTPTEGLQGQITSMQAQLRSVFSNDELPPSYVP